MAGQSFPQTLQEAVVYYSNPETAHAEMVKFRWPDGTVRCPRCGSDKVWFTKSRKIWQCKTDHPKRQFSVKIGSVMEDSPLGIDKWLIAAWLITNAKNGISSYELAKAIGVEQRSAWFMLHRIRLAMQDGETGGKLSGTVEVDETFIGGKARNMSHSKKRRLGISMGASMRGKVAVMGLLERHPEKGMSRIKLLGLDGRQKRHLQTPVRKYVEDGATINTDALFSYQGLDNAYIHNVIDHAEKYVDGQVHTNSMENFWSLLKRTLRGTYISVEPYHLYRYLDEQAFRFNTRKLTDAARFAITAGSVFGRRLTFAQLTATNESL